MISDGVTPSNSGAGYVLRRLIRRAVRFSKTPLFSEIEKIKKIYRDVYLLDDRGEIEKEEIKFRQTLEKGLKEFEKGVDPFILATTYGFPIELTLELAKEKGIEINLEDFNKKMAEHQKLSQTSSAGMFKGGLANHNEKTVRLHTAHHLLLAGLQAVVDKNIKQRGSNITEERLRMDFLCDHKLTDEEKKKVEDFVNEKIQEGLNVIRREMPFVEAEKLGAEMEFGAKYPDTVSLYFVEDKNGNPISKEFCGGPHVKNTGELGHFKIQKEEAVAAGIRRIKAVLL
jgi:alanyl-tRNA synthetase